MPREDEHVGSEGKEEAVGRSINGREPVANRVVWWILGVLGAVVLAGGAGWLTHVDAELGGLHHRDEAFQDQQGEVKERLAGVENQLQGLQRQGEDTRRDVGDIKALLERVLVEPDRGRPR